LPKKQLEELLNHYISYNDNEERMRCDTLDFLRACKNPFGKECEIGHITASAWIISRDAKQVLLTHHAKLNRWFQLGGHTAFGETIYESALREAREESGMIHLQHVNKDIFDLDVHRIPENSGVPEHTHYDIRFLFIADPHEPLVVSRESHDVKWISIENVESYSESESILRMVRKTLTIDIKTSN